MANDSLENLVVLIYMEGSSIGFAEAKKLSGLEGFSVDREKGTWSYSEDEGQIGSATPYGFLKDHRDIIGVYDVTNVHHRKSMAIDFINAVEIKFPELITPVPTTSS